MQVFPPLLDALAILDPDVDREANDQSQGDFEEGWIEFHRLIRYAICQGASSLPHQPNVFELSITPASITQPMKTTDNSQLLRNLENYPTSDKIQTFAKQKAFQGLTNATVIPVVLNNW